MSEVQEITENQGEVRQTFHQILQLKCDQGTEVTF